MLHEILKELREEKGITQEEVSIILNTTRQTISSYENGGSEPPLNTLIKLADLYNCSLDYLTGRTKFRYNTHLLESSKEKLVTDIISSLKKYDIKIKKEKD